MAIWSTSKRYPTETFSSARFMRAMSFSSKRPGRTVWGKEAEWRRFSVSSLDCLPIESSFGTKVVVGVVHGD